jgi:hypothetical protein
MATSASSIPEEYSPSCKEWTCQEGGCCRHYTMGAIICRNRRRSRHPHRRHPLRFGAPRPTGGGGPDHLLENGLPEALECAGRRVLSVTLHTENHPPAEVATAFELDRLVAGEVRTAVEAGEFPLVLSGNCNTSVGTLSGAGTEGLGRSRAELRRLADGPWPGPRALHCGRGRRRFLRPGPRRGRFSSACSHRRRASARPLGWTRHLGIKARKR